jgi:hypothetical protein
LQRRPCASAHRARDRHSASRPAFGGASRAIDRGGRAEDEGFDGDQVIEHRALGDGDLPTSDVADFWLKMSSAFHGAPGVVGYDLMNEPHDLPGKGARGGAATWETASQQAVSALRQSGDDTTVLVEGYGYAQAATWSVMHPRPWITDPANATRYEAHQYFDTDRSGTYARRFAPEQRTARRSAVAP